MNVVNVATLDIPEAMLRSLNKCIALSVDPRSQSTSHASSCTSLPALAALVTSLGPRLGGRLVEPRAQLGELDTTCNLSSFLEA